MNYKVSAISFLLNEDCILSRYYPLIPYKEKIIGFSKERNIDLKDELLQIDTFSIFDNESLDKLFKSFLTMYDNENKLKLLDKLNLDNDRLIAYKQLFLLPGVKETRAELYYLSGYKSLLSIANSSLEEILSKMEKVIVNDNLDFKLPLVKEVKTHIAVSKAFSLQ